MKITYETSRSKIIFVLLRYYIIETISILIIKLSVCSFLDSHRIFF
jgi:hypothetical protein